MLRFVAVPSTCSLPESELFNLSQYSNILAPRSQSTYIYRVPQCMSPRRLWDSPTPSLPSDCAPSPGTKGRGTLACGWGVGESQFRRLEKKLSTLLSLWPRFSKFYITLHLSIVLQFWEEEKNLILSKLSANFPQISTNFQQKRRLANVLIFSRFPE